MHRSKIEWCRNPDGSLGWVWNPITGCLGPDGKGSCTYCFASKLANGRLTQRYLKGNAAFAGPKAYQDGKNNPFYPRFWPERIPQGYHIPPAGKGLLAKGKGIFVCDMGELFGDWVPREWQKEVFKVIKASPDCRFYLLTKQPQNLEKFSPFPPNCWVGVSVTSGDSLSRALERLRFIEARIRFISFEPLLGRIDGYDGYDLPYLLEDRGIDWLIIGSQTKPYNPPLDLWVQEIVAAADKAGVPVFMKDNLRPLYKGTSWFDHPRQEMPKLNKDRKGETNARTENYR